MKESLENIDFKEGCMMLLDKPYGITSFGLVFQLKRWSKAKVGHAGTLDPLASGLMICCTGKWTKKLQQLTGLDKTYTGTFQLGATTPTFDRESLPENLNPTEHLTKADIEKAAEQFRGNIEQQPPNHSAVKQDGKRLYELAREGKAIKLAPRHQSVYEFEINCDKLPEVSFKIKCSSGTYIRSIANDMGQVLGCGAYLSSLVRTQIGDYNLEDAYNLPELRDHFGTYATLKTIEPKC
jgi:tRNA pseudouridine55 synthase